MTLDSLIMLSGAFVATLPFLGFPNSWDSAFFVGVGMFIIILGIVARRGGGDMPAHTAHGGNFVENMPQREANQHVEP